MTSLTDLLHICYSMIMLPFSDIMKWIQFGLVLLSISFAIAVLILVIYDTITIRIIKKQVFKLFGRLDDENYSLWKAKHKKELENVKLKRLLKKKQKKK